LSSVGVLHAAGTKEGGSHRTKGPQNKVRSLICGCVVSYAPFGMIIILLSFVCVGNFHGYLMHITRAGCGRLPIFLSNTSEVPGTHIPLVIFEPRYRIMVDRAMTGNRQFVLLREVSLSDLSNV